MEMSFFDIESTGLDVLQDNPIQLAVLEFDVDACKPIRAVAYYVKPRNCRWSDEAAAVHKISQEFLLENGQPTRLAFQTAYALLHMSDVAGYNSKQFDINMLNYACSEVGGFTITPHTHTDVMKYAQDVLGGKRRKLTTLTQELGLSVPYVEQLTHIIFKDCPQKSVRAHDARYDVVATAYCYSKLRYMERKAKEQLLAQERATKSQFTGLSLEV